MNIASQTLSAPNGWKATKMSKVANNHTQVYLDSTQFTLTPNWNFMLLFSSPLNTSIFDIEFYFTEYYDLEYGNKFDFNLNHKFDKKIYTEKLCLMNLLININKQSIKNSF